MPERNVIPKPLQKPHPPLWVASSRRETTMVAARLGMGSLGFAFETPDEAQERVENYYELVREECFPIGAAINPALAVLSILSCFDSDEEAIAKGQEGAQFFAYSSPTITTCSPAGTTSRADEHLQDLHRVSARAALGTFGKGFRGSRLWQQPMNEEPEDEVT
jgi:alkanesulfonate monooxygenase SsuD/methylene tetrahydromethanopterin reductase-like flavin-dependent oxidoreductase (luciferase family)